MRRSASACGTDERTIPARQPAVVEEPRCSEPAGKGDRARIRSVEEHGRPSHQPLVPGGPRKSVVSWGKAACDVGWALNVVFDGVETWLGLSVVGGAGGLGALPVEIVDGTIAGMGEGACVGAGASGACAAGAVLVVEVVGAGMTAPVGSMGSRATTATADTMIPTARTPSAVVPTAVDTIKWWDHRTGGAETTCGTRSLNDCSAAVVYSSRVTILGVAHTVIRTSRWRLLDRAQRHRRLTR